MKVALAPIYPVQPDPVPAELEGLRVNSVAVEWALEDPSPSEAAKIESIAQDYERRLRQAILRAGMQPPGSSPAASGAVPGVDLRVHVREPRDMGPPLHFTISLFAGGERLDQMSFEAPLQFSCEGYGSCDEAVEASRKHNVTALMNLVIASPRLLALARGGEPRSVWMSRRSGGPVLLPRAETGPTPAWVSALGLQKGRARRLAVLEFRGALEAGVLAAMSDAARSSALDQVRGYDCTVMTRESMAVMLKEMGKAGTCTEGECEVETARNIGADLVISGEVIKVEDTWLATLKLHETARGALVAATRVTGKSALELIDNVGTSAPALFK